MCILIYVCFLNFFFLDEVHNQKFEGNKQCWAVAAESDSLAVNSNYAPARSLIHTVKTFPFSICWHHRETTVETEASAYF